MINIYPQRATNPNDMDIACNTEMSIQNVAEVSMLLSTMEQYSILCCWGNLIEKRGYLRKALIALSGAFGSANTFRLGEATSKGHPRHPLMLSYTTPIQEFALNNYYSQWDS